MVAIALYLPHDLSLYPSTKRKRCYLTLVVGSAVSSADTVVVTGIDPNLTGP
jgi:hypothetical protein